ncbi:MAG: hypothetical protein NTV51_02790, partial [Verrucomicrobia bacterium]|nr:hypothetical protein [Verrucomicrobiota bacterium]
MSTIAATSSSISRGVIAPPRIVTQGATLAFANTAVAGADTSLALKSAHVGSKTTQLAVNLALQTGRQYTLRRGAAGLTSTLTATLVDTAGNQTALSFNDPRAATFTVGAGGAYQLILSDSAPLK